MNKIIFMLFGMWYIGGIQAQSPVERAIVLGSEGRWEAAYAVLQPALQSSHQQDPHAWYIMGFVQKERYKASHALDGDNPERLAAVQAFQRCRQLAPQSSDAKMAGVALEYLAESFYQDAHARIARFEVGDDQDVLGLLRRYESVWSDLHADAEFTDQEFDLYHRLAEANSGFLDLSLALDESVRRGAFEQAVAHYEAAERLRPEDERTQYNLAVTWYNEGVRKLRGINSQTTFTQLMQVQASCVEHYRAALEPMEAAYALNSRKASTVNGLMLVHRALEQRDKSERFKRELEALR